MKDKHELTQTGLDELQKELDRLKNEDRLKNIEALKEARAQGDLSENADYDAARDEQARIENRIKELQNIINNAVLIGDSSTNNLGKHIVVEFENMDGYTDTYTLVGSLEADPENKKISNESPLGQAILKAKVNERVFVKTEVSEFYIVVKDIY